MKSSLGSVGVFILSWLFILLLVIFFIQSKYFYGGNPIFRPRLDVLEAFQSGSIAAVENSPEINLNGMTPGDPDLTQLRRPYALLKDWLPLASEPMYMTAKDCHEADFQGRLEKTRNFRQMTNNYKRGDPDSCSGPIQDLTFAFYKTEPIANVGCTQPFVEK
jgi:hypothetical protein